MLSQQIVEWGKPLEERESPTPQPVGTEVLVRVEACGVCHSDLHIWDGYFDLGGGNKVTLEARGVKLPFTMGHEIVGVVEAVGPEAEGAEVGQKRVVYPWIGCGQCAVCRRGDELLCMNPVTLGTRRAGGYADRVLCPHPRYLVDYDGVPADLAATYACSGLTAYSALRKLSHLTADDWLLVVGAGGVGLSGVHIAKSVTPAKVVVADVDGTKRAAARQAGAAETIDNREPDALAKLLQLTGGGPAGSIDFVGAPATSTFAIDALRKGGKHVVVGLYGDAISIGMPLFPFKMMTVEGSYVGTLEEMRELMALVKAGKVPPIPVARRPLAQATQALRDLREGKVLGRVVLKP